MAGVEREAIAKSVDAAILPIIASLGSWGVASGHWLPDRDGAPVIWLRTRTEGQRTALHKQVWLLPQVQITLTRLGLEHELVWRLRIEITSEESETRLFAE